MASGVLVVDVGTSGVRTAVVRPDGEVTDVHRRALPARSPFPGLVEIDAVAIAAAVLDLAAATLAASGPVEGVGIANQRATTVVWDRDSGEPVAPGIGWQDLRTVGTCLAMQADGFRFPPNASATKVAAILDDVDPDRARAADHLCFGTVDTWVAWTLSGGRRGGIHVTDPTNAAVTWMLQPDAREWDARVLDALRIPPAMLPTLVDSSGVVGEAQSLPGAPPICGLAGDQQASMVGQGCTRPGLAKATFGTGGMLDVCTGAAAPDTFDRAAGGTFPIVAWQRSGAAVWGTEAIMLSAGSSVQWLADDLAIIADPAESAAVAARCADTDGLVFVPALLGLGTPVWDFGARGTLLGLTIGSGRPQIVRAVLEGVAHRGADLLEAAESDTGTVIETLRIDGGMSANDVFVQALADATGRPIEVSAQLEATTLGAGHLAGMATGWWGGPDDLAAAYVPARTVEPRATAQDRERDRARWLEVRRRAERTIPELSAIDF